MADAAMIFNFLICIILVLLKIDDGLNHYLNTKQYTRPSYDTILKQQSTWKQNLIVNKRQRIPKGKSKMDDPEILDKTKKNKTKTQHNMCWASLCAKETHKMYIKMCPPTNNWK